MTKDRQSQKFQYMNLKFLTVVYNWRGFGGPTEKSLEKLNAGMKHATGSS